MDLALNNLQGLICHKTKQKNAAIRKYTDNTIIKRREITKKKWEGKQLNGHF